jgi:hypothetical protein
MANHKLLRLSSTLVLIGAVLVTIIVLYLHPGGGSTLESVFAAYAASGDWMAIHLGQFIGMAAIGAGLLVLYYALNVSEGTAHWLGFFAAISAVVAISLAAVTFAVDGVANKQAVDAWVSAPAAEQAARFASAETLRWLEMATSSYLDLMLGFTQVLFAIVIVWTARVNRGIGILMGLAGLAYLVQGWLIGTRGFTSANTVPTDAGYTLLCVSMLWLYFSSWLRRQSAQAAPA